MPGSFGQLGKIWGGTLYGMPQGPKIWGGTCLSASMVTLPVTIRCKMFSSLCTIQGIIDDVYAVHDW